MRKRKRGRCEEKGLYREQPTLHPPHTVRVEGLKGGGRQNPVIDDAVTRLSE